MHFDERNAFNTRLPFINIFRLKMCRTVVISAIPLELLSIFKGFENVLFRKIQLSSNC